MHRIEELFLYSLACEIFPDLSQNKAEQIKNNFAIILKDGKSINAFDVTDIQNRTDLLPRFIAPPRSAELKISRSYARRLGVEVVIPRGKKELKYAMKNCLFTVSEGIDGALISFLSDTPVYINAGCKECRTLLGKIAKFEIANGLFIPYTKNRTAKILRPVFSDSDFIYAKNKFRAYIDAEIYSIFNSN